MLYSMRYFIGKRVRVADGTPCKTLKQDNFENKSYPLIRWARVQSGYTLVEILVMTVLLIALVSLGLSFLKTGSSARMAKCMLQQQQIHKAILSYNHNGDELKPSQSWVTQLLPYLDNKGKIFVCPEESDIESESIIEAQIHVETGSGHVYYLDIFEGPFARKLSETQYQQVRDQYGELPDNGGQSPWEPYFDGSGPITYPGFVADEHDSFWIIMEDIQQEGIPGGDKDFDDVVLHILPDANGLVSVEPYKGTTGFTLSLVDPYSKAFFIKDIGFEESRSAIVGLANADYGMNINYRKYSPSSQILLMDFQRILINPENHWQEFIRDDRFTFARHNDMVNVIFSDGHAESFNPFLITPTGQNAQLQFWGEK